MKKTTNDRRVQLLIGSIGMLFAGVVYAWSILKAPLAAEFSWSASQLALNYTLTMSAFCIGGILSGYLLTRWQPRHVITLTAIAAAISYFLVSRLSGNLLHLYLSYGILCGGGIGMTYNTIIAAVTAWFPDKRGFCSGVLMMCFGASTLVIGTIISHLVTLWSWRIVYAFYGLVMGVTLLLVAQVVRFPSQDDLNKLAQSGAKVARSAVAHEFEPREMLKTSAFWVFFLYTTLAGSIGNAVISMAQDLVLATGGPVNLAALMVGLLSICNGTGRVSAGLLYDRIGRVRTMQMQCVLAICASSVLTLSVLLHSAAVCTIGLCLTGLAYGFGPSISSGTVSSFFGTKHFSLNFSISNLQTMPSAFAASFAGIALEASGGYLAPAIMLIGYAVAATVLMLILRDPQAKYHS